MSEHDWRREIRDAFVRRGRVLDDDVLDELTQHAVAAYAAARAEALASDDARARVRGEIEAWSREAPGFRPRRARWMDVVPPPAGSSWLVGLIQDIRYGVRLALQRPGATGVSVLTIALGIAAATSLFSLAYGVLLRPLPWPDADRLVRVTETHRDATRQVSFMTNITYNAWHEQPSTIESLAAYANRTYTLDRDGDLERVRGVAVTPNLFPMLRATARHGRVIGEADENVVLLSERFARSRFADAAAAPGQRIRLGEADATVVGVMPDDFAFPSDNVDLWVPYAVSPTTEDGSLSMFSGVARLRPGVSVDQAADEATARGRAAPDPGLVIVAVFGGGGPVQMRLEPWLDSVTGDVRPGLLVLLAGVVLLLAAAVGNLASVQLARATGRRRELAIRASIGAGRLRLARQLLVEAVIVAVAGGAAGLLLTAWLHGVLPAWMPSDFPRIDRVAFDATVVGVGVALALAAGLIVGTLPALQAGRLNLVSTLAEDGLAPVGHSRRSPVARARALIIAGQIAVSVLLLVGAGLLVQTLLNLTRIDHGYTPANLLTGRIISAIPATPRSGLPGLSQIVERLASMPGVSGVALATALPMRGTGESMIAMRMEPDENRSTPVDVQAKQRNVSIGYFDTLGMRFVEGRAFTAADVARSNTTIAVVNETFARAYLGERRLGPFGRVIEGEPAWDIVGVVQDVPHPTGGPAEPEMFIPLVNPDRLFGQPYLFVRTTADPTPFVPTVRTLTREINPALGFDEAMTMDDRLADEIASPRLFAMVAAVVAGFALLIAGVGLFGVLSYSVSQRRREIGVRSALGATPGRIVRLVVGQGLGLAVAGSAAGLLAAAVLARYVSSLLYGVTPFDPLTFLVAPVVLLVAAVLACFVPARRAARIDPLRALRQG